MSNMALIPPGATIGILGGGQLGRMLAIAAAEMGYHAHIYCPESDCPASEVAKFTTTAAYDDVAALKTFADSVDVITYEFENIPAGPLKAIADKIKPGIDVLELCQHRVREKEAINKLGVATAPFQPVSSFDEMMAATKNIGLPAVVKTCRNGYDGKGQAILDDVNDPKVRWEGLKTNDAIVEGFVLFRMEISVIVARGADGKMETYCPVENIHKHHILSETIAPARIDDALAQKAEAVARTIAQGLNLVGLMAVEMFVTDDNKILVNELAPRPHNSGHWTIDACSTSQFHQTIRAICGLPLGSTRRLCDAKMLNLIGDDITNWHGYLLQPNVKLHLYGKSEAREGRKMGHVTTLKI